MRPTLVSEKVILEAPYFTLKRRKFKVGYKKNRDYYDVTRLPIVIILPVTKNKEIYLIRQYRYLYNGVIIEPIAGHVEKGESSVKAATRELKEEAGIEASQLEELLRLEASGSVVKSTIHYFLAKDLEITNAAPEDDEEIELFKLPLPEALSEVMKGNIKNSSAVVGILLLNTLLKERKL